MRGPIGAQNIRLTCWLRTTFIEAVDRYIKEKQWKR